MIGNDIRVLRTFGDLGVRYMTLTHFYNDEWADSSTAKPEHNGLTDFGKQVVMEMNRQGIMVDISHVSDKTFYDALAISKAPLIASHSSCRALCDHVRDMSDDMIKALAAKGGVIQINYEKSFDHIDHAVKLVGADHVGLGSDFDGADMPDGMEDCTHLPQITEALMRKGYADDDIRKILGGNLLRVMEQNERVSREMQAAR